MVVDIRSLLARYVRIQIRYGIDSPQAKQFKKTHADNKDLLELVQLSDSLRKAIKKAFSP